MFTELLSRLTGHHDDPLPDTDARLALGALLVRIAKSDHHYAVEEISQIDRILADRYGLKLVDAMKLRATAEKLEAEAPDTGAFVARVKTVIPYADRSAIAEALWRVVRADGVTRDEEAALFQMATETLGVDGADLSRSGD